MSLDAHIVRALGTFALDVELHARPGEVDGAARPEWRRQEHPVALPRGPARPRRRTHHARRSMPRCARHRSLRLSRAAPGLGGVPELSPVSQPHCARERRVRVASTRRSQSESPIGGGRLARACRSQRSRAPSPGGALGRSGATSRARTGSRDRAAPPSPRRAACGAGRRRPHRRAARPAETPGHIRRRAPAGDPRPRGRLCARRPGHHPGGGRGRAVRHPRRRDRAAPVALHRRSDRREPGLRCRWRRHAHDRGRAGESSPPILSTVPRSQSSSRMPSRCIHRRPPAAPAMCGQ